jgi:hypothetical protein
MKSLYLLLFLTGTVLAEAETIPLAIPVSCEKFYTGMQEDWGGAGITRRAARYWSGMQELMSPCEVDPTMAAKSITVTVDKAGLDQYAEPPGKRSEAGKFLRRQIPFMKKQSMKVDIELENGRKLQWNFYVSTGNHFADDPVTPQADDVTPPGSYDLNVVNRQLGENHKIYNSQAYCVANPNKTYVGTPMPYSVFFKAGYAFHSGKVSGYPESHGCVRLDPQNARAFYCLLRQKTTVEPAPVAETKTKGKKKIKAAAPVSNVGENYMVTKIKICEDAGKGCDEKGMPTKKADPAPQESPVEEESPEDSGIVPVY